LPGTVAALTAAALGLGFGIAHWTAPAAPRPLLSPLATDPPDAQAAEARAIAVTVGMVRASDGMTFDAWYRQRLARLCHATGVRYRAGLQGNAIRGYWSVWAESVPPGPGPWAALANVDETTGAVDSVVSPPSALALDANDCARMPHCTSDPVGDFRAGAAP
jgi:hypothetical protein